MATQVQLRRGNTTQTNAFTGAVAEITVDTDKETVVVHDGSTAGGFPLARESALSSNATFSQAAFNTANTANVTAQAGFAKANSANVLAQAAFDNSNTKFNSSGGTISGDVFVTGNLFPSVDNTGIVGNSAFTWANGQFTNLTVDTLLTVTSTLNVRVAIDLADDDILRFGTSDDWEMYHTAGGNNIMDLNTGNLVIRDDGTTGDPTRFTFERLTGNFTANGNVSATNFLVGGLNVNSHAQSAFNQANTANITAEAAFSKANTDVTNIVISPSQTYGNATHVPVVTVTANGRINAISTVAITATDPSAIAFAIALG